MSKCLAGIQYLPSIEYFAHWLYHGTLVLEKHEHYHKKSWRNRTAILSPDQPVFLSVPLRKGKNQQLPIDEVQISYDEDWSRIHFNSLKAAYGKTAFFEELESDIDAIYKNGHQFLWDLNMQFIQLFISFFQGDWKLELTQTYEVVLESHIVDLRKGIAAGSGSPSPPCYQQIHRILKSHLPNLSILDVLCHLGPDAVHYLKQYAGELYKNHEQSY